MNYCSYINFYHTLAVRNYSLIQLYFDFKQWSEKKKEGLSVEDVFGKKEDVELGISKHIWKKVDFFKDWNEADEVLNQVAKDIFNADSWTDFRTILNNTKEWIEPYSSIEKNFKAPQYGLLPEFAKDWDHLEGDKKSNNEWASDCIDGEQVLIHSPWYNNPSFSVYKNSGMDRYGFMFDARGDSYRHSEYYTEKWEGNKFTSRAWAKSLEGENNIGYLECKAEYFKDPELTKEKTFRFSANEAYLSLVKGSIEVIIILAYEKTNEKPSKIKIKVKQGDNKSWAKPEFLETFEYKFENGDFIDNDGNKIEDVNKSIAEKLKNYGFENPQDIKLDESLHKIIENNCTEKLPSDYFSSNDSFYKASQEDKKLFYYMRTLYPKLFTLTYEPEWIAHIELDKNNIRGIRFRYYKYDLCGFFRELKKKVMSDDIYFPIQRKKDVIERLNVIIDYLIYGVKIPDSLIKDFVVVNINGLSPRDLKVVNSFEEQGLIDKEGFSKEGITLKTILKRIKKWFTSKDNRLLPPNINGNSLTKPTRDIREKYKHEPVFPTQPKTAKYDNGQLIEDKEPETTNQDGEQPEN